MYLVGAAWARIPFAAIFLTYPETDSVFWFQIMLQNVSFLLKSCENRLAVASGGYGRFTPDPIYPRIKYPQAHELELIGRWCLALKFFFI